jgi:hypothetical protein
VTDGAGQAAGSAGWRVAPGRRLGADCLSWVWLVVDGRRIGAPASFEEALQSLYDLHAQGIELCRLGIVQASAPVPACRPGVEVERPGVRYRTPRMRRTSAVPATKQRTAPPKTAL